MFNLNTNLDLFNVLQGPISQRDLDLAKVLTKSGT